MTVADRLADVRGRIAAAAARSGRNEADVILVAVTKYAATERVIALAEAGQDVFGENRVQDAIPKMATVSQAVPRPLRWHMIGHLQRNKVRQAVGPFALIESVDSVRLGEAVAERARADDASAGALLQVNVSADPAKFGFDPDEVHAAYPGIATLGGLDVQGLMTIGAVDAPVEASRRAFAALRDLRDELAAMVPGRPLPHLSMGMSADFEVAIEEGATIVRVGTALFGSHHSETAT